MVKFPRNEIPRFHWPNAPAGFENTIATYTSLPPSQLHKLRSAKVEVTASCVRSGQIFFLFCESVLLEVDLLGVIVRGNFPPAFFLVKGILPD